MPPDRPHPDSLAVSSSLGTLRVFSRGQLQLETPLRDRMVLGRQRSDEPEPFSIVEHAEGLRVIIANRSNQQVSRGHLRIDRDNNSNWVVTNSTRNCVAAIDPGHELLPGKHRVFDGAIRLEIEGATIVIDASPFEWQLVSLGTPSHRFDSEIDSLATRPPSQTASGDQSPAEQARPLVETLGSSFDESQKDCLLEWLRLIAQLFRHVDDPNEYIAQALKSAGGMIGASAVLVLEHRSAASGEIPSVRPKVTEDWRLIESIGFDEKRVPDGLPALLARVFDTRQSVLFRDRNDSTNRAHGEALVQPMIGTPVLDSFNRPAAALVAIREAATAEQPRASWGEMEACFIELIASGINTEKSSPPG